MKKLIVLTVLIVAVTGFAAAGGLVFHLGAGYHSSYMGNVDDAVDQELKNLPLGIGGYAGLGYGFGDKKTYSIGAEFAPSWDISFNPSVSNFNYQARAFLKFKPAGLVSVTGFGGWGGASFSGSDISNVDVNNNFVFGARLTVLFLYAEYAAVMNGDMDGINKHEIGVGFAIFK